MRFPVLVKKPFRDLKRFRTSALLLFVAIAVAVAAAATFVVSWSVLDRETGRSFNATRPLHVELILDRPMTTAQAEEWMVDLEAAASNDPGLTVTAMEPARRWVGRIETGAGFWKTLILYVRRDASLAVVETADSTAPDPGLALLRGITERSTESNPLLIERSSVRVAQPDRGARARIDRERRHEIRLPEGGSSSPDASAGSVIVARFAGELYDGAQAPGWMENMVYAYLPASRISDLGLHEQADTPWDRVWLRFAETGSIAELRQRAEVLLDAAPPLSAARAASLQASSPARATVWVPIPDTHPHAGQMKALLWTVLALGLLVLFLVMVAGVTLVGGLLARQRQVLGIVKALGGSHRQTFLSLAPTVLLPAFAAFLPGAFLGLYLGRLYVRFAADMLNVSIESWRLESMPALVAGLALLLALMIVVLTPFRRAARRPAREYLAEQPTPVAARALSRVPLPVPAGYRASLLYVVRNLWRQPRRTFFTLVTLAIAGVVFLSSANLGQAWLDLLAREIEGRRHDAEMVLREPVASASLAAELDGLPEVAASLALRTRAQLQASDDAAERISLLALDSRAGALRPTVVAGSWLGEVTIDRRSSAERVAALPQVVLNQKLAQRHGLAVGDTTSIDQRSFLVVGLVEEVWAAADAYCEVAHQAFGGLVDRIYLARGGFFRRDFAGPPSGLEERRDHALLADVESRLAGSPASPFPAVAATRTRFEHYRGLYDHVVIFLRTFQAICLLLGGVALFALASMLALSVLERSRELGVLRVLGASPRRLAALILSEGLVVVLIGFTLAALLSIPISLLLGDQSGRMFVGRPLPASLSFPGYLIWLLLLLAFGTLACWAPGRHAARVVLSRLL